MKKKLGQQILIQFPKECKNAYINFEAKEELKMD